MRKSEKIAIVNNFIYANFNCCSLTWHFGTSESISKFETIRKRFSRIALDENESNYNILLRKCGNNENKVI